MGKQKIKGKDLKGIGYQFDQQKSLAINIMMKHFKHLPKVEKMELLRELAANPEKYKDDEHLQPLAETFMEVVEKEEFTSYKLVEQPKKYEVYGKKFIDQNTLKQMDLAMRLPIAHQGALMPDAHVGYGLPIGGVLATKNEVIPYGVGLDIGCRMALTIFDAPFAVATRYKHQFKVAIQEYTFFGTGVFNDLVIEHEIMDRPEFKATEVLSQLHGRARRQLGTSGSGNHFVEFGEVRLEEGNQLNLPAGSYVGLLTHSGSRGLGATIAQYYTKVAMDVCRLPRGAQHLAWLDLNKEEGMEYWLSMNLAGDYAKACHDVIHASLGKAIGLKPLLKVENHHNFAWKEQQPDGSELIVHRKGATPAKEGELGIIPGTMAHPAYIVAGNGAPGSIQSASHGAGRKMSRQKARESFTRSEMKKHLKSAHVTLLGGGIDEAPMAYKNIEEVMNHQQALVSVQGMFYPQIVRMNKE